MRWSEENSGTITQFLHFVCECECGVAVCISQRRVWADICVGNATRGQEEDTEDEGVAFRQREGVKGAAGVRGRQAGEGPADVPGPGPSAGIESRPAMGGVQPPLSILLSKEHYISLLLYINTTYTIYGSSI